MANINSVTGTVLQLGCGTTGMVWVHVSPQTRGASDSSPLSYEEKVLMGVVSSRIAVSPSTEHEGPLNGLTSMIWYGPCSHQISIQLNTSGIFWINALESFTTVIKSPAEGISLGTTVFHFPCTVPDTCGIYAGVHWGSSGGSWWCDTFLRHLMLFAHLMGHIAVGLIRTGL